jgi:hypothetical protein
MPQYLYILTHFINSMYKYYEHRHFPQLVHHDDACASVLVWTRCTGFQMNLWCPIDSFDNNCTIKSYVVEVLAYLSSWYPSISKFMVSKFMGYHTSVICDIILTFTTNSQRLMKLVLNSGQPHRFRHTICSTHSVITS